MRYHEHRQFRIYQLRGLFLRIGFAITLLLVILAFSWKTEAEPKEKKETQKVEPAIRIIDTIYRIPPLTPPAPKAKPPVAQQVEGVKINPIEDGQQIEEKEPVEPEFSLDDAIAQNGITEETPVIHVQKNYVAPEKYPEFPGGLPAFYEYIRKNVQFPKDVVQVRKVGTVHVTFIIDTDGQVVEAKVAKGVMPSMDAEALRLVRGSPRWKPGMMGARAVRVILTLPIHFQVK